MFYSENIVVYDDKETEEKYLTLDQLGTVLRRLTCSEQLPGTKLVIFDVQNLMPVLLRMGEPEARFR